MIKILLALGFVALASGTISEVVVELAATIIDGCDAEVKCLVTQTEAKDITYKWEFNDVVVTGETKSTLSIAAVDIANDAKAYKCTATDSDGEKSNTATLNVENNGHADAKPSITDDKSTTEYGEGDEYTLTCASALQCGGAWTYEWLKGGVTESGETSSTYKYTATSDSTAITCKTTFKETESVVSAATTIEGKKITYAKVDGPTTPVDTIAVTYTCSVTRAKAEESNAITYQWSGDGGATATTATDEYTPSTNDANKAFTCTATVNGETKEETLSATSAAKPSAPTVSGATEFTSGGDYELSCNSMYDASSYPSTAPTFSWQFTPDGGSATDLSCTTQTCTISGATSDNAGAYTCKVKVSTADASDASTAKDVTFKTEKGVSCSDVSDCTSIADWDVNFSGNCIAKFCECKNNGEKTFDGCTPGSSGTQARMSIVGLVVAALIGSLVRL